MESLDRCRIILGLSKDNTPKLELVEIFLEKAREDIEAFCRDNFIDESGADIFPVPLKNIMEDLAIQRFRKLGAEGDSSYSLADESVSFEDKLPDTVKQQLYSYRRLFPRENPKMVEEGD